MKTTFIALILIAVGCLQSPAQNTAAIRGDCRSIQINPGRSGSDFTYFTTYDGSSGFPLNHLYGEAPFYSGEMRSRSGSTTVFEADWVGYHGNTVDGYGSMVVTVPFADSDGNGLNDVCEKDKSGSRTISWTCQQNWPESFSFQGTGTLARQAGQVRGQAYLQATTPGVYLYVNQFSWEVLAYTGSFRYTRGAANSATWDITMTDGEGESSRFVGTAPFAVSSANQINFPQFTAQGTGAASGTTVVVNGSTFNRTGNRYIGSVALQDGGLGTYWRDYAEWVFVITDGNDANGNGIPDLSDVFTCSYALPSSAANVTASGTASSFTVTAGSGCAWTAAANQSWLRSSSSGTGNGVVNYTVDANTSAAFRSGTITVGGQTFTVTQGPAGYAWRGTFVLGL